MLAPGGWVFTQTDVPDLAAEIRSHFEESGGFEPVDAAGFQSERLGGVRSHRERKCIQQGIPVERMAYLLKPEGPS